MAQISVGLDLGSYSLKVIELKKTGAKFSLLSYGSIASPPGGLLSDSPVEHEAVSQAIKKLFKDAKISSKEIRVALPESQVFTFVIETPPLSEKELSSSIRWEAEQYIPIPLEEVVLDWKILTRGLKETDKNQVLLVAAPKRVTDKYQKVLDMAGLNPLSLETELIAATRSLTESVSQLNNIMVVNMGAGTTDFSILSNKTLLFTRSINAGGIAFTRAIKQDLQLEDAQAEEYKKAYGLEEDKLEGKVGMVLKPLMNSIIDEMKKGIGFFSEKYPNSKLDVLLLSGGSSLIPGLIPYFTKELGIETQIGNPLASVELDKKIASNFTASDASAYAVSVGLAMREGE